MAVELYSLADLGYRKLGPLPAAGGGLSPEQVAADFIREGDYEVASGHWVRRPARRKGVAFRGSTEIVTVLDRETPLDDDDVAFIDQHALSAWTRFAAELPQVRTEFPALVELVQRAENTESRWHRLYRLSEALFFVGPELLRPMFRRHVAPCFFRLYPEGKIVVLRYDTRVDEAAAFLRAMYAMAQAPAPELIREGFRGVRTLCTWHMTSLARLVPALLDLFSHLFYPFVGGACAGLPGLAFLFLLDPAERHMPAPFPRNWLGFPARSASFAREEADPIKIVQDFHGPAYERASHHRLCHVQGFSAQDRLKLLRWYVDRVNRLLYELTDAANFTEGHDRQAALDPVFGFEHQLTVDRLLRKTLTAMSLDEAPTANLTVFEIADLYDTLSERFRNHKGPSEFFKKLFHTKDGPALITLRLAGVPVPFAGYFADLTAKVYAKVEETVLASVWRQGKLTPGGVLVRDRDLSNETTMPVPQFVAEVMRAYRNAHHGYFTSGDAKQNRPSRFLFLVNGNLPVEMSALPVLWWLAYLADPGMVGWKHLPVGAFD
jgi:hypothetical protein